MDSYANRARKTVSPRAAAGILLPLGPRECYFFFMNDRVKLLGDQARELTPVERAKLVDDILLTLDAIDPPLDALWTAEAKERSAALKRGEIGTRNIDDVLGKYPK